MKKRLGLLIAGSLSTWLISAYPAQTLWGESAVAYGAVALVLCLVPASATLLWAGSSFPGNPEQLLALIAGSTVARMVFVLGLGLILYHTIAYFHQPAFWLWILAFYLLTLTLEMVLILAYRPAGSDQ